MGPDGARKCARSGRQHRSRQEKSHQTPRLAKHRAKRYPVPLHLQTRSPGQFPVSSSGKYGMRRKAILRRTELGAAGAVRLRLPAPYLVALAACMAIFASAPSSRAAPSRLAPRPASATRVAETRRPARSGNEALLFALGVALALCSGALVFVVVPRLSERRLQSPRSGPLVRRRHSAHSISQGPTGAAPTRVRPPRLRLRLSLRLPRIGARHSARSISKAQPPPRLRRLRPPGARLSPRLSRMRRQ